MIDAIFNTTQVNPNFHCMGYHDIPSEFFARELKVFVDRAKSLTLKPGNQALQTGPAAYPQEYVITFVSK